jgi:hypothetical protein
VKVTIVVPLDQNEAIIAWLGNQQATTAVPLAWLGRTWLETQLASRPHLVRAFARTTHERTLERLAEFHAEQAVLPNGMPDAITRFQRLQARTDELDPHFRFEVQTAPGQTTVTIVARTEHSLEEHPITVSLDFAFPANDPRAAEAMTALARSMDYGDPVTVPPEYVADVRATLPAGLGQELGGGATVSLGPTVEIPWDKDGRVVLLDGTGRLLQQLPVRFTSAWAGRRGFVIDVEDLTGTLRLGLRGPKDPGKGDVQVRFTPGRHAVPSDLLGPLRFFEALRAAVRLRLVAGARELCSIRVTPIGAIPSGGLGLVEALARIQERTGVFFALPTELSEQEVNAILTADTLLLDGQVTAHGGRSTLVLTRHRARQLLEAYPSGRIALWQPNEPFAIRIAGHELPLGPVSIHAACARFEPALLRRRLAQQPARPEDQLLQLPIVVHAQDGPTIRLVA